MEALKQHGYILKCSYGTCAFSFVYLVLGQEQEYYKGRL